MFHYSTPFDYSHSHSSPFSHYPSSSLSSSNTFLPPSYASCDEERSLIEQALLARKQQERRRAEAAAFLAEQRRLERQAVIEEAIREERERREYERALRYREELNRKAREEEETKRRYLHALRVQQELARRQDLQEQREQRRRDVERAAEQRQIDQPSLDTMPELLQSLFRPHTAQYHGLPRSTEQVLTPLPSTTSPSPQAQIPQAETPQLDLPHFLEAIFGAARPSATTQAPILAQQAPKPVSQPSPSPFVQTSSSPSFAPATSAQAPTPTPAAVDKTPADSSPSDEEEEAATKLQRQFRRHLARRTALDKISSLSSSFIDRQSTFEKPSSLMFKSSPDSTSSTVTPPPLAFVSTNSPFLAYEDYLVNLLTQTDTIESGGDRQVKKERKSLVRRVEKELSRLDAMKERAWEEQLKEAQVAPTEDEGEEKPVLKDETVETEQEVAPEQPSTPSAEPQATEAPELEAPVEASLPAPSLPSDETLSSADSTPAPPSDDDLEPLIPADTTDTAPQLTEEAVSSLPPRASDSTPSPRSDDASSTTSSTLTESSDDSPVTDTVSEVLRRAEKLGQEVEKLELAENTSRDDEFVFVL